jgi:pimeloyl-ACP methyl ester carboxylesterase
MLMSSPLRRWLALSPLLGAGCGLFFPAPTPMRTINRLADSPHAGRCVMVFLPGFGDDERAFLDHGFDDALRARSLHVEAIFTAATYGYYAKRTILGRLREDVVNPALAHGYEQIWLVGVSMGGLGALLLAKEPDTHVAGALLLAPYLGEDDLLREVDRAGGIARWEPGPPRDQDYQRDLWRFLKSVAQHPEAAPAIYLAAGDRDKLAQGHRLLAASLPPGRVFSIPGRHDWKTWSILWARFLDDSDFRARCG